MKLGCGMYGLAFELEKDFWGTMQKLADAGFTAIEPLYAFPNDPALAPDSPVPAFLKTILWDDKKVAEYQPRLREMGLEISSLHVGFFGGKDLKEGCEQLVDCAKKSGITHFLTSLEFDNEEKTLAAAELLNKAEEYLKDTGVSLGYHNHAMEFNKIADGSDRTWMDLFLEKTVSDVKCQLDTGWQMYGGFDVLSFVEKYKDRIISIHLKDFVENYESISENEAFAAIGDGVLPTEQILDKLSELHMIEHGLMIDQDKPAKGAVITDDLHKGATWLASRLA